jgi:adenylate kinase family enzyme
MQQLDVYYIISKWQKQDITKIENKKKRQLSALLFADDQVTIADTEDNLQKAVHKLNQIITEYGLTISVQKTKLMTLKGRDPVRTEIVIDNKAIQQVNFFNYLGNMICYEGELDIDNKLNNFLKITGILNNVFRPQKTVMKTRIKLHNKLALPVLLYGSETWSVDASDTRRITAAEMKYMGRAAGYIWD